MVAGWGAEGKQGRHIINFENNLFPGFPGLATGLGLFVSIWLIVYLKARGQPVIFDPAGKHGEFGKTLLPMYLDITKTVLGLAAGSIVLLVGSMSFNPMSGRRSLTAFASPLFLVAMTIIYGVLFMILLALSYEHHLHHPNQPGAYTLLRYTRNQSLGFSALACFCISYIWLIAAATK
jgi:heme/copper-type cytochrome/quinol oxidase subunit 3